MKMGSESRAKLIAAIILMVVAVALVGQWLFSSSGTPSAAASRPSDNTLALDDLTTAGSAPAKKVVHVKKDPGPRSLDPTLRYDWLKASEATEYKGSGRNIFQAQLEVPQPQGNGTTDHRAPSPSPAPGPTTPPPPPPPPPSELKFFGFASHPGQPKKIFLSQGDDVFIASEGDIVDRRYKVMRISANSVEIEDVLNNNRQEIPLTQG
jgi:hypothetical protein